MNKKIFLSFAAAIFIFAFISNVAFAQTTDGLIGYWKFDGNGNNEISGGTAAVSVGSAEFRTSGGKDGGYLYVDKSSDWGKIPYSSTYDLANAFTVEFWFRQRTNQNFNQNLVYKGSATNNYNFLVQRWLWNEYNQGPVVAGSTAVNTGYWSQVSNGNQLAHGQWHHVAYARTPQYAAYYLDGVEWNYGNWTQNTEYSGSVKTPAVDIIIGDSAVDTDFDNLRIYNRALSYLEVTQNGGFPAPTTTSTTTTAPTCSSITPSYCYTQSACTGIGAGNWCEGSGGGFYCTSSSCPTIIANQTNATTTTAVSATTASTSILPVSPPPISTSSTNATSPATTNLPATTATTFSSSATSNTCSVPNGMGFYSNGLCAINYCNSGYYNCDSNSVNGCESMSPCSTSSANGTPAGKKQTCTDTDAGISTYSRGFTTGSDGQISEDKCAENNLTEFYCKDGEVASHETACSNGCNDGACVSPIAKLIQDLIALIKSIFGIK